MKQYIEELAVPLTYKLIQELEEGFSCSPLLNAFSVFILDKLPQNVVELDYYGNVSFHKTLVLYYDYIMMVTG